MATETLSNQHHDHYAETRSKVIFGFWTFILSDCVVFAALFAAYAVLHNNTFGGVGIKQIASLPYVLVASFFLLASSFTSGLAFLSFRSGGRSKVMCWLLVTFILGLAFIAMSVHEFAYLINTGNSWQRSAFLSSFFTLVGIHAVHVTIGLIWMLVLMVQLGMQNTSPVMKTRLICLGLFWNFLDIIWIFIFTIVYLMGAI